MRSPTAGRKKRGKLCDVSRTFLLLKLEFLRIEINIFANCPKSPTNMQNWMFAYVAPLMMALAEGAANQGKDRKRPEDGSHHGGEHAHHSIRHHHQHHTHHYWGERKVHDYVVGGVMVMCFFMMIYIFYKKNQKKEKTF